MAKNNVSLEKVILEEITLTDVAKKDIDISSLMEAIDKQEYSINATMSIYKSLVDKIKYNENIREMLEDGYDINFKNMNTIDESIRGFFIKIKRGGMQESYSSILKGFYVLGEILQQSELEPKEILDDLIILADLNRVKAECFEEILKRMLVKYHSDVEERLGVKPSLNELQVVFFEGCLKGVKDICYDYIKQIDVPIGLRTQYMEICSKYIIDTYKLNIPTISYTYSYIHQGSERYNEIITDFRKYLIGMQVEKIIVNQVCSLYKEKIDNDMNVLEIEKLLESSGYIKKEVPKGRVSLSTRGICYDIKKMVDYIKTDDELREIKESINYLLEQGILQDVDVYLALRECEDEYKVMNILEELLKRDIDDELKKEIAFFAAEKRNGANIIKLLINKGLDVNECDIYGKTPLMYACKCGNLDMVKVLMETSRCVMSDKNETSILMYACESGAINVAKYLVKNGVDVNQKNRYKKTALMYAYQNNDLSLMKFLLQNGADVTIKDKYRRTIIEDASRKGKLDVIELIIKYVPNVKIELSELLKVAENPESVIKVFKNYIDTTEENGKTPLVNLCSTGDFKLAKMLLDNGANINKVDESRKTALHNAFARGNKEEILFLVQNGADKQMAVWHACYSEDVTLLKALLEEGANLNGRYIDGETLLMIACMNSINPIWQDKSDEEKKNLAWRGKKGEMKEFLLENSVNINQKSDLKINALTYAWVGEDTKTATILIRKGIDVDKKDVEGIMKRYGMKDKELVKALLERGVKINQTIKDKELQVVANDIKEIKKACKKDKLDNVMDILKHSDSIAYRRMALRKLLGKHMFDSLSKKTKRTNLAKNIVIELLEKDNDFLQWIVNSKSEKVLDLLIKEKLFNKEQFERVSKLVEYSNNNKMKKMLYVPIINASKKYIERRL